MKQHHLSLRTKDAVTGFLFTLPALVGLGMFFVVSSLRETLLGFPGGCFVMD